MSSPEIEQLLYRILRSDRVDVIKEMVADHLEVDVEEYLEDSLDLSAYNDGDDSSDVTFDIDELEF